MNKTKVLSGLSWNFLDNVFNQGVNVIVFVILARLLSPEDFGLLGILLVFISVSKTFVDAGLSQALIKKRNCTNADYNTVFFFNILIGFVLYGIIYFTAPFVSMFFELPKLTSLIRLASIVVVLGSFTIIQQTKLTKSLNFKAQAIISLTATILSGLIAIYLAYQDYGVWSLVWRTIVMQILLSILFWIHNRWLPKMSLDVPSFLQMLGFSYKILISLTIANIFTNVYNLVIGKLYSTVTLGYYTTSNSYSSVIPNTINSVLGKVIYPAYAEIQDDDEKLKRASRKITKGVMYITFYIMLLLAAVARPLFNIVLGEKWEPAILYFQILCLGYMMLPLIPLNHTILYIKGRSDLVLITDILKYVSIIPFIGLGLYFGMTILVIGFACFWWISFAICAMYTKRMIYYSIYEQIKDLIPYFLISLLLGLVTFFIEYCDLFNNNFLLLLIQLTVSLTFFYLINELLKLGIYMEGKQLIILKIKKWREK